MKEKNYIQSTIETINPDTAKLYLKTSTFNRQISLPVVMSYANSMKEGKWILNGEPIVFDKEGHLINGHHRLQAIVKADTAIQTFVVRGVEHAAFNTFDCGRNRTFGQLLGMQGVTNHLIVASIVNMLAAIRKTNGKCWVVNGRWEAKHIVKDRTNEKKLDLYQSNKDKFNTITKEAISLAGHARLLNYSIVGGMMYYLVYDKGHDIEIVKSFFAQLLDHLHNTNNQTIETMRQRLVSNSIIQNQVPEQIIVIMLIKTWNAYISNIVIKRIPIKEGDEEIHLI